MGGQKATLRRSKNTLKRNRSKVNSRLTRGGARPGQVAYLIGILWLLYGGSWHYSYRRDKRKIDKEYMAPTETEVQEEWTSF
jgi:hypothetical protein